MSELTLTDFLLARIAELADEALAHPDPDWVLAECEAKRRIVAMFTAALPWDASHRAGLEAACMVLALPYADHPDYREEWKP